MTGIELKDSSEGIYDDGEWISWEYINQQIYVQERQAEFPAANPEVLALFDDDLLDVAIRYKQITGRYLPLKQKAAGEAISNRLTATENSGAPGRI